MGAKLTKLKNILDAGPVTQEEYDKKRAEMVHLAFVFSLIVIDLKAFFLPRWN